MAIPSRFLQQAFDFICCSRCATSRAQRIANMLRFDLERSFG
jgi:hypothetical protein